MIRLLSDWLGVRSSRVGVHNGPHSSNGGPRKDGEPGPLVPLVPNDEPNILLTDGSLFKVLLPLHAQLKEYAPEPLQDIGFVKVTCGIAARDTMLIKYGDDWYTINLIPTWTPKKVDHWELKNPMEADKFHNGAGDQSGGKLLMTHMINFIPHAQVDHLEIRDSTELIDFLIRGFQEVYTAKHLTIQRRRTTNEEVDFIRRVFENVEKCDFFTDVPPQSKNFPLEFMDVKMIDGKGLGQSDLQRMQCRRLEVQTSYIRTSQLRSLINLWLGMKIWHNLESLVIRRVVKDISLVGVLNGFHAKEWEPTRRSRYFPQEDDVYFDCQGEWDIVRERDNLLATVILTGRNEFRFYVWKDPYPAAPDASATCLTSDSELKLFTIC